MHLTRVLNAPPVFRYWKHFGAGFRRRQPNFKKWQYNWIAHINRRKIPDHTIPKDMLPPGARVMEAEELLQGNIDDMPDEIIRRQKDNTVYDHPWPFNAKLDPIKNQEPIYHYNLESRFYTPREDCLVLTNTIIESDTLEANPPIEPNNEDIEYLRRQYDWATQRDSVLVRLPKKRQFPRIDQIPRATYGLSKSRKESNILNTMSNYAQMLLSKHYHGQANHEKLNAILDQRSLSYPHCQAPFEREPGKRLSLDLFIDSMLIGKQPLPQIDLQPTKTKQVEPLDIKPRTWRSLLEQTRNYSPAWSFTLPRNAYLHTIQLNSQILREHRDTNEMLARSVVHAFGLTSQFARLRALSESTGATNLGSPTTHFHSSCILLDPLSIKQVNDKDLLDQPVVLQTIGYDHNRGEFLFMRYQLNTLNFDDKNPDRIKNQAWHSGPISELDQALRYYLDFQAFDSSMAAKMISKANSANEQQQRQ